MDRSLVGRKHYNVLHFAADEGDLDRVRQLVEECGMNINEKCDVEEKSPLFISCSNGHLDVAAYLIEKGADIDSKNHAGFTPLYVAAAKGHLDTVKFLIKNNAKIDVLSKGRESPLTVALKKGHEEIVNYLLDNGANLKNNFRCGRNTTILHKTAAGGNLEFVKDLLEDQVNVNIRGPGKCTPLFKAVQKGHLEIVKYLVGKGAHINVKGTSNTPLTIAVRKEFYDIVDFLVKNGADVNLVPVQYTLSPLHIAVTANNTKLVRYLVKHNADAHKQSKYGTPLYIASKQGNLNIVKTLFFSNPKLNQIRNLLKIAKPHRDVVKFLNQMEKILRDMNLKTGNILSNGDTLLHKAVQLKYASIIKDLLEAGANPNVANKAGHTPLALAVQTDDPRIVSLLIDYKADINQINLKIENFEIFKLLFEKGTLNGQSLDSSLMFKAAEVGEYEMVKFLVEHKMEVNCVNEQGFTPLFLASKEGNQKVVSYLLSRGAEINLGALNGAISGNHPQIVEVLLRSGANVNEQFPNGDTPIHQAALTGNETILKDLITAKANINVTNKKGQTPLYLALKRGHLQAVKILISSNADLNLGEAFGYTPLYGAVSSGNVDLVKYLMEKGAQVNDLCVSGDTPLHQAAKHGHLDAVRYLVDVGAEVNAVNEDGWTAVYLAAKEGSFEVVKFLREAGAVKVGKADPLHAAKCGRHQKLLKYLSRK